jgi:biopolymer transport protein ExbD
MRRFSQRNALVTLSEINITPLLDLAFVLLIIFVITTPLLEQGIDMKLPDRMGKPDRPLERGDIRTVEVNVQGNYWLNRRPMSLDQIVAQLVRDFQVNPNLLVYIRGDENGPYKHVAAILDRCERNGITRFSLRTEPERIRGQ